LKRFLRPAKGLSGNFDNFFDYPKKTESLFAFRMTTTLAIATKRRFPREQGAQPLRRIGAERIRHTTGGTESDRDQA